MNRISIISPKDGREATPVCYPSSERLGGMRADWVKCVYGAILVAFLCKGVPVRAACQQLPALRATDDQAALPVTAVRLVSEDGGVLEASGAALKVEIGKPLDRTQVAE